MKEPIQNPINPVVNELEGKYLTFRLAEEFYAVSVKHVREIIRMMLITRLPRLPEYVRGVINLRGKVVPVIDLRAKFGMSRIVDDTTTCIIVVNVKTSAGADVMTGVVVDAVEEVLYIAQEDIEDTPDFGGHVDTKFIMGMAKVKGRIKALLDIEKVIGSSVIDQMVDASARS